MNRRGRGVREPADVTYPELSEYVQHLKIANPGTLAEIETYNDESGLVRFKYLFLCFGASRLGLGCVRKCYVLAGARLGGMYKGSMLTLAGQDANLQTYPIAFAIVDGQNEGAWNWFMVQVKSILEDSPNMCFIMDLSRAIMKAKWSTFPLAADVFCEQMVENDVKRRFKDRYLTGLVEKAAYAYRKVAYANGLLEIKDRNIECWNFLERLGKEKWCRANFSDDRYNLRTTQMDNVPHV
ncbi:uncharacterized protein LOC18021115 [Eutrema salsugineum]|uniref:uncharacterized protein LOC18021115 n=1 Tax=Eutrema salsugineum TaxID=72664 RepID=UPI000CECFA6A|nr:uncharacterized protein LOC18021115 [Eutrema salsugineum]